MSKPYRPSNGSEGEGFTEKFCERCTKNRPNAADGGCKRLCNSMVFGIEEDGYPKEWICDDDSRNPRCTAFKDKASVNRHAQFKMRKRNEDKQQEKWAW